MATTNHVCNPDSTGYCGECKLICKECKHKGMVITEYALSINEEETIMCPACKHTTKAYRPAPGTEM